MYTPLVVKVVVRFAIRHDREHSHRGRPSIAVTVKLAVSLSHSPGVSCKGFRRAKAA